MEVEKKGSRKSVSESEHKMCMFVFFDEGYHLWYPFMNKANMNALKQT